MKQLNEAFKQKPNAASISLEFLNIRDLTTMIPKLKQFKNLQTLSLHGNQLTYIPTLQILQGLKELDISHNPIKVILSFKQGIYSLINKIDNHLLDSLFTIPNLQSLLIDVRNQEDRMMILQNLPKLQFLNGKPIYRQKEVRPPKEEEMKAIKQRLASEQHNIKTQLYNIYNLLDQNSAPPDLSQQVTFSIKCIIEEFEYFYENINSELARDCVYLYYKNKLYQVIDTHLSTFLQDHDHQNIASAIDQLNKNKKEGFQEILKIVLSFAYEEDFNKKTLEPQNKLRKQVLYQNQITRLKKQVSQLIEQNHELQQNNQKCMQKIYHNRKSTSKNVTPRNKNHQASSNGLNLSRITVNTLTPMNKSLQKTPLNRSQSKREFSRTPSKSNVKVENYPTPQKQNLPRNNAPKQSYQQLDKVPSYQLLAKSRNSDENVKNFEKPSSSASFSAKRLNTNFSVKSINKNLGQNDEDLRRSQSKQHMSQNQEKKLTLDQMVQFIDEFIYEKGKINLQCQSKGELFQTPQQFLYTFFLRKYGLKEMALQWSLMVIKAIQNYSKHNVIVEVFGKILKNTIQEEFYFKCKQFQDYLNSSVPLVQGFTQDDVREIFFAIFPDSNSEEFQKFILKAESQIIKGQKIYPRRPLLFKLERFYVTIHQTQINKFLNHFKIHDKDDDGMIENDEIQKCISSFIKKYVDFLNIYQSEENLERVKEEILSRRRRKGNIVSMTFSQFISAVRNYF